MATAESTRPATSLRILCDVAEERGLGLDIVLEGTGLTARDVGDAASEITTDQELRAVQNFVQLRPDEFGLGVTVGERMHVNSFGIWGFAVLTSPTFRAATVTAMDHIRLSMAIADMEFTEHHDVARIAFDLSQLPHAVRPYVFERHSVVTLNFSREAVDRAALQAFRVETTQSDAYAKRLARMLGLAVVANAPFDAVVFPSSVLDLEVPRSDPATLRYCLEQCELLGARLTDDSNPWTSKVRDILVEDIGVPHQIASTADRLAVNERTLRRRLAAEGSTFREIYADTRMTLARELLETTGLSVEATARRVGFAEPASFVRSFSRHYGETPGRVRRSRLSRRPI